MAPWDQGEEGAEDGPFGSPPPPDDRLWRHPSELSGAWLRSPETRRLGRPAMSVLAGLLVGAALATAGVVLVGTRGSEPAAGRTPSGSGGVGGGSGSPAAGGGIGIVPTASTASTAAVGPMLSAPMARLAAAVVRVGVERDGTTTWGCGFASGSQGEIVTAAPLVQGATGLSVVAPDGTRSLATLLGSDTLTGVAVLRIGGSGGYAAGRAGAAGGGGTEGGALPRASVAVGDVVLSLAPGSGDVPAARLAMGEVTAVGVNTRDGSDDPVLDAISTDLPVGTTALGAPVLDSRGRVLGMVVSAGAGRPTLTVPIGTAEWAASQLVAAGSVSHGWLGVEQGRPASGGVAVAVVAPGSPAAAAGIVAGDLIVAVDGQPVRTMEDLEAHFALADPGRTVTLQMSRPPRTWSVRVVLARLSQP